MNTKGIYDNRKLSLKVIFTLAFAVFFFFGVHAYADDAGETSPAPLVLAPDIESVELYKVASEIKAATNTTMDLDDIYVILNDVRKADPNGNIVWQVYDNVVDNDLNVLDSYSGEHLSVAQILYKSILGARWDNPSGQIGLLDAMKTMWSTNHADQLAQMTKQQAIINALSSLDSNQRSDMLSLISALNTFKSANHTDITSLQSDYNNIGWVDYNGSFTLYSDSDLTNQITTSSSYRDVYIQFNNVTAINGSPLFRFTLPIYFGGSLNPLFSLEVYRQNYSNYPVAVSYYADFTYPQLTYLYFNNLPQYPVIIHLKSLGNNISIQQSYISRSKIQYLLNDSEDYYKVSQFIVQNHIDTDIHHHNTILDRFKDLYASDDLVAAKQAQQAVEDSAIADFSGNGSASMKGSDVTSAKNISNQVKDGLNAGGSVSNGLSAFSSSNAFWGWFSQDNANYFTVDFPIGSYPQPTLRSVRSQWTDDVPDVISSIDEEYFSQLGGE